MGDNRKRFFYMRFWRSIICKINDMCTKWRILIRVEKKAMEWWIGEGFKTHGIENKNFEGIVLGEYNGDDNKILKILFL